MAQRSYVDVLPVPLDQEKNDEEAATEAPPSLENYTDETRYRVLF
jgi:hypothetical protein